MQRLKRYLPLTSAAAQALALLVCGIYVVANVIVVTRQWEFDDVGAYLAAAERLQHGLPLYVTAIDTSDLYLYAPWFAFIWIPLTHLPRLAVEVAWAVVLLAATGLATYQFRRSVAELCLALLLGALLFRTAGWGNLQPILVLSLIYLLPTRAGPWTVGVAASLKVLPILFVAAYFWRREWSAATIALCVTGILWVPIVFFDLSAYPTVRGLNLYDATLLLAVPAAITARRSAGREPGCRPDTPRTSPPPQPDRG